MITIDQLRKAFAHLPKSQFQIPMNVKNPQPQQVAAVTQTLAGERMTHTVSFPTTGDLDCDFIQGLLAVLKASEISTQNAVLVLRYMAERMSVHLDRQKQPSQDIASLVRMHVQQYLQEQALRQASMTPAPPWYGGQTSSAPPVCPPDYLTSAGSPVCTPPCSTSAEDPFNGMSEFQVKAVMDSIRK